MNWTAIIIVGILAIAFLIFLVIRNQKDEKDFENNTNNDYPKKGSITDDIEADELTKEVH